MEYEGPEMITSNSCGMSLEKDVKEGIRVIQVYETRMVHTYYDVDSIPSSIDM